MELDNKVKDLAPTRTVYCYYYPEIREIVSRVTKSFPHEVFLRSINPGLDNFHEPLLQTYVDHMRGQLDLDTFPYRYFAAGASEIIFHVLAEIASHRPETPLYVFEGEYEGYAGYGANLGLKFEAVKVDTDFKQLKQGIFFISNPSARDGNILPNEKISQIGDAGHEIILDATYVGLTAPHQFLCDHPSISRVLVSMSKPFGLYYYRVGFCFSRKEMKTLEVNKWFKNVLSIIIAKEILVQLPQPKLYNKYSKWQDRAIKDFSDKYGVTPHKSDVMLLAYLDYKEVPQESKKILTPFDRGINYRFCLTPYYLEYEREA